MPVVDTTNGPSIVKVIGALEATEQKAWMVGGGYDFGIAKVTATYGQTDHNIEIEDKIASLGLSYRLEKASS